MRALFNSKKKLFIVAVCILILGYIAAFSIINFFGFTTFLNPDMYSDTLVARYMWEKKTIFPENWVFGNQYYVIATPVLAALFYGATGSMNLSMALATSTMIALQFLLLYFMLRPYFSKQNCLFAILTFAASNIAINIKYNFEAQLLFTQASYYACYMITVFWVFGDYVKSITNGVGWRMGSLVLSAVLCFCTGMQSIRQTVIMVLPMISFECLRLIGELVGKKARDIAVFKPTLRVFGYTVSNLLGVAFIKYLKIPAHTIYGNMRFAPPEKWRQNLSNVLAELKGIVGISKIQQYGNGWFIAVFSWFTIICVVIAVAKILLTPKKRGGVEYYILLLALSIVELCVGSVFVDFNVRSLYFFLWYPLIAISQVYLVTIIKDRYRPILITLVLLLCAANLIYSYRPNVKKCLGPKETTVEMKAADWLCENGYEILYAFNVPAAEIAAETDGQVTAACWHDDLFIGLGYINAPELYDPERNEKAAYYLTDAKLPAAMEYAQQQNAELTCLVHFDSSGLYSSDVQLMTLR